MVDITRMNSTDADFWSRLEKHLAWESVSDEAVSNTVRGILADVRKRGDAAVIEYTNRFDRMSVSRMADLEISQSRLHEALGRIPATQREALEFSAARLRAYHAHQKQESWSYTEADGTLLGQQVTPLDRAGLYVPGGKAAYPSSVLMNAIPAKVAGVPELIMVVPTPDSQLNELVLAAAAIAGVDRIFAIGGAQAVAALAYGTQTVPQVDKIVGPGNIYVATAKGMVYGTVGIDMIAGPSEILVVCDGQTDPDWIAMDLFSQAEHDEDAQSILVCPDAAYLDQVQASIGRLLPAMERAAIIEKSLSRRAALIKVRDLDEAVAVANFISPEHLELSVAEPRAMAARIRNAGAIFMGRYTAEAVGDYCAGPNHVLPTSRTARFSSPLGVYDFQKRSSLIMCSADGASTLGKTASLLARGEGLTAHARSAEYRIKAEIEESIEPQAMTKTQASPSIPVDVHRDRVAEWIRPEIRALSAYHVPDVGDLIKLDAMENPYTWPLALVDDWLETLRHVSLNRYPDPHAPRLKAALRERLAVPDGMDILLGNGSDELIQMIDMAVGGPGRVALSPEPSFSMYRMIAAFTGLNFAGVPLNAGDFSLDMAAMREAIARHQPAVVFLSYPNNPTGNLFDEHAVCELIETCPGLVVVDEAYSAFAGRSMMDRLGEYDNLLVLRTLSKMGLAGLRLGILAGSPRWLNELDKLRLPYNINVLTQASAEFALRHYDVLEGQAAQLRADREQLLARMRALPGITVYPSQANFILFRVPAGQAPAIFAAIKADGVLIKSMHGASSLLNDCLRVTVGAPEENAAFLAALDRALATALQNILSEKNP